MNIKINQHILIIGFLLFVYSCTASKRSKEERSLNKAFENALYGIQKGNSIDKNKEKLSIVLSKLLTQQIPLKDSLLNLNKLKENESGYEIIDELSKKIQLYSKYVDNEYETDYNDLQKQKIEIKENLKEQYYERGVEQYNISQKNENKIVAKKAYLDLQKSRKYGMKGRILDSLEMSSKKYAIRTFNIKAESPSKESYKNLIDDRFKNLEKNSSEFNQIFYNDEKKNCDCNIKITFDQFVVNDHEESHSQDYFKEIKEESRSNDGTTIVKVITISATVNQTIKSRQAGWNIIVNSNNANCNIESRRFVEEMVAKSINIRTSGDRRAVPEQYLGVIEEPLMRNREIAEEMISRIYLKIEQELRDN